MTVMEQYLNGIEFHAHIAPVLPGGREKKWTEKELARGRHVMPAALTGINSFCFVTRGALIDCLIKN